MCSWGYVWQSQRCDSYQKGVPSWGEKRGSGPSTHPSGEVLAWLLLLKRVFKCQFLYVWKSFCKVGRSQLFISIGSWHGIWCRQKHEKWDSAVCHAFGAGISVCASGGHLCFIWSNLWSNLWLRSLRSAPQITWFTVVVYPPFLLSDRYVPVNYFLC